MTKDFDANEIRKQVEERKRLDDLLKLKANQELQQVIQSEKTLDELVQNYIKSLFSQLGWVLQSIRSHPSVGGRIDQISCDFTVFTQWTAEFVLNEKFHYLEIDRVDYDEMERLAYGYTHRSGGYFFKFSPKKEWANFIMGISPKQVLFYKLGKQHLHSQDLSEIGIRKSLQEIATLFLARQ